VIPTDAIAQSVAGKITGGGNVGVLIIEVAGGNVGRIIECNVGIPVKVKWNVVVGGGNVGRIIEWNVGIPVRVNCGEDSGAK
jgi:ribosomal protein S28E/S33